MATDVWRFWVERKDGLVTRPLMVADLPCGVNAELEDSRFIIVGKERLRSEVLCWDRLSGVQVAVSMGAIVRTVGGFPCFPRDGRHLRARDGIGCVVLSDYAGEWPLALLGFNDSEQEQVRYLREDGRSWWVAAQSECIILGRLVRIDRVIEKGDFHDQAHLTDH